MLCPVVNHERGVGGTRTLTLTLLSKRLSKHQTTGKWLVRNDAKFEFMAKQVPECTVSGRKKKTAKKRIWITNFIRENQPSRCPWRAANFPHDNRKTNCSLLAALAAGIWKTAGHFTNEELQHKDSELVIWRFLEDRATPEVFHSKHLTGYLVHIWASF